MTRTVGLSAHCDDLAFSIGGMLFDGCCAPFLPLTVFTFSDYTRRPSPGMPAAVSVRRKTEDRRFFSRVPGALPPVWLDRPDAPLRLGIAASMLCTAAIVPADDEVAELAAAIAALLRPGDLLAAPLALGGHPDHRLLHLAAKRLFTGGFSLFFYEDLPYASELGDPEIVAVAGTLGRDLGCEVTPRLRESAAVMAARAWAVRCYSSQVGPESLELLLAHPRRLGSDGQAAERIWLCAAMEGG